MSKKPRNSRQYSKSNKSVTPVSQKENSVSPQQQPTVFKVNTPLFADELNSNTYKERLLTTFPSIYTTLISIIQGVAISILVSRTIDYIDSNSQEKLLGSIPSWIVLYIPFTIILFLLIVIVTFEYTWYTALFRYEPRFLDITIPLGLGFFEILPMYYFTNAAAFCLASAFICFNSCLAYWYSSHNLPKTDVNVRKDLTNYYRNNIVVILISGCVFLLLANLIHFLWKDCCKQDTILYSVEEIGVAFLFFILEIYVIVKSLQLYQKIAEHFGYALDAFGLGFLRKQQKKDL